MPGGVITHDQDPTLPDWIASIVGIGSHCRSCGAEINWARTTTGKSHPLNPDNTSHFATCPEASSWRKPR